MPIKEPITFYGKSFSRKGLDTLTMEVLSTIALRVFSSKPKLSVDALYDGVSEMNRNYLHL